jgi:hypothetical protein
MAAEGRPNRNEQIKKALAALSRPRPAGGA